jgi:hypothetical protein
VSQVDNVVYRFHDSSIPVREIFALEAISSYYNKFTGEDLIHVVNESPISFYISFIVPRSSPFLQQLNIAITRSREFGFIEHANLKVSTLVEMRRIDRYKKVIITYEKNQKIAIEHLVDVFKFFLLCIVICVSTFFAEILVHKKRKSLLSNIHNL